MKNSFALNILNNQADENSTGGVMKFACLIALFAMVSCASHVKVTNKLSLGMDRLEVEKLLGEPETTKASAPNTYLTYKFREGGVRSVLAPHETEPYVMVFNESNKLVRFGHLRDFREDHIQRIIMQND